MLKRSLYTALLGAMMVLPAHEPLHAASDEEKRLEAEQEALDLVIRYGSLTDPAALKKIDGHVQKSWNQFTAHYGYNHQATSKLALLRARSSAAAKRKAQVSGNWKEALQLLPITVKAGERLRYYTEAAQAAGAAEDYQAAEQFYAAARTYAEIANVHGAHKSRLYIRLQELRTVGQGMEWRRLNDSLLDMRKYAESFVMWSLPRLDALIGEAEIRLMYQPHNYEEKRKVLGELKTQIILIQKGMGRDLPAARIDRIRSLFYALEDHFDL